MPIYPLHFHYGWCLITTKIFFPYSDAPLQGWATQIIGGCFDRRGGVGTSKIQTSHFSRQSTTTRSWNTCCCSQKSRSITIPCIDLPPLLRRPMGSRSLLERGTPLRACYGFPQRCKSPIFFPSTLSASVPSAYKTRRAMIDCIAACI